MVTSMTRWMRSVSPRKEVRPASWLRIHSRIAATNKAASPWFGRLISER